MQILWYPFNESDMELVIEGMRLSYGSGELSDSFYDEGSFCIGAKDLSLMKRLIVAGDSHSLFMRFISVFGYIKAPRYWWQQFDRYKSGVERMSGSTMHTVMKRELTQDDFVKPIDNYVLSFLNELIKAKEFMQIKNHLPEGFLQKRMVKCSYQVLRNMRKQREKHKLIEWQIFIEALKNLQWSELIFV